MSCIWVRLALTRQEEEHEYTLERHFQGVAATQQHVLGQHLDTGESRGTFPRSFMTICGAAGQGVKGARSGVYLAGEAEDGHDARLALALMMAVHHASSSGDMSANRVWERRTPAEWHAEGSKSCFTLAVGRSGRRAGCVHQQGSLREQRDTDSHSH